jgi:hypothetical protein
LAADWIALLQAIGVCVQIYKLRSKGRNNQIDEGAGSRCRSLIVPPSSHGAHEAYEHNGLRVRRLNEVCGGVLRVRPCILSTVLATDRRVPNFNGRSTRSIERYREIVARTES